VEVDFLERVAVDSCGEQWLVRDGEQLRIAHVFPDDIHDEIDAIEAGTRRWLGFSHPRMLAVHAVYRRGVQLVIVTGDERGTPLLEASRRVPETERERWGAAEICAIADAITAMGTSFIHRRASNEQIVVGADGLARLRAPIALVSLGVRPGYLGRARYVPDARWMSPEQARGLPITPASDVYQLGFTLYCALLGRYPFGGGDHEVLKGILEGPRPPIPSTIPGVRAAIERAIQREAGERFATVGELAHELRRHVSDDDAAPAREKLVHEPPHAPPQRSAAIIGFKCQQRWERLAQTAVDGIRHCHGCDQDVVQVRSIEAAIPLLGRRCIRLTESD
jgi:serine/threonine-protein kinase